MRLQRTKFFGLGIILIFAGIIVSSYSNMAFEVKTVQTPGVTVYNKWNVTRYFTKGETLILDIPPPKPNLFGGVPYGGFNISIVAQNGKETVFWYEFSDGTVKVKVKSNDGALIVNESSSMMYVTGVTAFSGNYTAYVDKSAMVFYNRGPPSYLTLKSMIEKTSLEYPYRDLLPVGILIMAFGSILIFLSFREPKRAKTFLVGKKGKIKKNYRRSLSLGFKISSRLNPIIINAIASNVIASPGGIIQYH